MSALSLWLNILLGATAFVIIVVVPMWAILRHPDRDPAETRRLPAYLRPQPRTEAVTQPASARTAEAEPSSRQPELAGRAGR